MKPEDVRREILRLEDERLRMAPEVMGGDREALEEDRRLERRIMELAGTEREARADELRESWRRNHPGGEAADPGAGVEPQAAGAEGGRRRAPLVDRRAAVLVPVLGDRAGGVDARPDPRPLRPGSLERRAGDDRGAARRAEAVGRGLRRP